MTASILIVDDIPDQCEASRGQVFGGTFDVVTEPRAALLKTVGNPFELIIVNSNFEDYDLSRQCSQLRSAGTHLFPVVSASGGAGGRRLVVRALDLGVNGYFCVRSIPTNLSLGH